jgi:hypothetical protein
MALARYAPAKHPMHGTVTTTLHRFYTAYKLNLEGKVKEAAGREIVAEESGISSLLSDEDIELRRVSFGTAICTGLLSN